MPKQIRAKDIKLDDVQKEHIEKVMEGFKKYGLDITRIITNVSEEKKQIHVEFEVHVAHSEPIVINEIDDNFNEAVDKAAKRVEKALRRLHDKIKSPKHESLRTILNEIEE
ncbi:Ribosomal subunit interface protein [hydrothermal vent metagenome]|uniref:Ribosomal subunit interface protein n=1 Tax=hydrothermal vent metagenome TaxID=652676 RepID=A0A1W1C463_9ZZZZ